VAVAGASGSIDRRRLGIELRALREEKGLTLEDVKAEYGWSTSKVSRMERGLVPVNPADLKHLIQFYGVTDKPVMDVLLGLASGTRGRDWWHRYDDVIDRRFSTYLGFEKAAASVHNWEPLVVPGLLQTAEYARALVDAHGTSKTEDEAARRVEARMYRQQLLTGDDAPRLHAIIDESVLHRLVGGPGTLHGQLMHLHDAARRPNVTLQVVPFAAGALTAMEGGFIILRFAEVHDGDVVSVDLLTRSLYLDDPAEAERYRDAWESVLASAADPATSLQMIKTAANKETK